MTVTSIRETLTPQQTFRVITPAPREVWQALLEADPNSLLSQTPAWFDCICAMGSYEDASRLYEMSTGQQLILPLVRRKGWLGAFGWEASPPHGWGIGGLISRQPIQRKEITAVFEDLTARRLLRTTIRPNPLDGEVWESAVPAGVIRVPRLAHVLDLEGSFEHVWMKRFKSKTRRHIRKAERANLVVTCDHSGKLVPVFYELLQQSFERWATQQNEPLWLARWRGRERDPEEKFHLMAERLGEACSIWVAWVDEQPAAAILVLQGKNAHYTRGAMNKELAAPTRANYLLHRQAIEAACQAGSRYYHMGDSGTSTSLARFKRNFGALPYSYASYCYERLPLTKMDHWVRGLVKKIVGFKDA